MKYLLLTSLLLLPIAARAQRIYPSAYSDKVLSEIARSSYSFPDDWHVYVANDAQFSEAAEAWKAPRARTAFTVISEKMTFVRKSYFDSANPYEVRHTLAHEMGHIICQCNSETAAENFAALHAPLIK